MIGDSNKSKEYLIQVDGDWKHVEWIFQEPLGNNRIEIPDGAEFAAVSSLGCLEFRKGTSFFSCGDWLSGSWDINDFEKQSKWSIVWKRDDVKETDFSVKPVKSDGGSSSYYFTALPEHLIADIVKRGGIEIKDIVRYCFDNDADCKDIIKALKRIRENLKGGGKEGVDCIYDANKICFFAEELRSSLKVSINK